MLKLKDSTCWVDSDGQLQICCPTFSTFGHKCASTVSAPTAIGSKCPGFPITIKEIRIKRNCLFGQAECHTGNSYWNKQQWRHCHGCTIVEANISYDPKNNKNICTPKFNTKQHWKRGLPPLSQIFIRNSIHSWAICTASPSILIPIHNYTCSWAICAASPFFNFFH
ncbi:hypothetical protein BC830DRAFT_313762 [Chytriomyces sp. MP71]|nr:hypothetical protein BC830DRAFT_313762 [Chytriomyces sp. MP71]